VIERTANPQNVRLMCWTARCSMATAWTVPCWEEANITSADAV
jgi:hypothetical protein